MIEVKLLINFMPTIINHRKILSRRRLQASDVVSQITNNFSQSKVASSIFSGFPTHMILFSLNVSDVAPGQYLDG